jgi:hypothetical protein
MDDGHWTFKVGGTFADRGGAGVSVSTGYEF